MGEVYRARDTRLGREVAVKILRAEYGADAARLARFEREARAAGALNHPNVLALYDLGTHEGTPYLRGAGGARRACPLARRPLRAGPLSQRLSGGRALRALRPSTERGGPRRCP